MAAHEVAIARHSSFVSSVTPEVAPASACAPTQSAANEPASASA